VFDAYLLVGMFESREQAKLKPHRADKANDSRSPCPSEEFVRRFINPI